jgi:hypothetical protein
MTRGTFYLITNDKLYSSTEFNGDMYPEGHRVTAKKMLEQVTSIGEFKDMIKKFNVQEDFNYKRELVFEHPVSTLDKYADFNYEYFTLKNDFCWFSDWLFIKNISDKEYTFTYTDNDGTVILKPGEMLISSFGGKVSEESQKILDEIPSELITDVDLEELCRQIKEGMTSGRLDSQTDDGKSKYISWKLDMEAWVE